MPPTISARHRAAKQFHGDIAHQILAAQPLAPFGQVRKLMFEKLSGEQFNEERGRIYSAAKGLQVAKERQLPLLLVLYRGHGKNRDEWDSQTKTLLTETLQQSPVKEPAHGYILVGLPLRELSALTNLAKLPVYEVNRRHSLNLVLADSQGKQLASLPGNMHASDLARQLWPPLLECRLLQADHLSKAGKTSESLRLLRGILTSPFNDSVRLKAKQRIDQVNLQLAETWSKQGRFHDAARMYRRVEESETAEEKLRQRAREQLAKLN